VEPQKYFAGTVVRQEHDYQYTAHVFRGKRDHWTLITDSAVEHVARQGTPKYGNSQNCGHAFAGCAFHEALSPVSVCANRTFGKLCRSLVETLYPNP
jgi:hypothetical protein